MYSLTLTKNRNAIVLFGSMSSNLRPLELEIVKKMFPFHISTGNMTASALSGSKRSKDASITTNIVCPFNNHATFGKS